jgi:hypothetical protein
MGIVRFRGLLFGFEESGALVSPEKEHAFGPVAFTTSLLSAGLRRGSPLRSRPQQAIDAAPHLAFVYPQEGFPFYCDCAVILRESRTGRLAHQFLDYLLRLAGKAHFRIAPIIATWCVLKDAFFTTGNPLRDREAQEVYEAEKRKFDAQYKGWQTSVEGDVARFREQLTRLLSEPATAPRTDISDAIRRADVFLSEPQPPGRHPTHRYLICASDGRDNVRASPVAMSSQARLLIVNSSGSLGSLESLKPLRFESLSAATDFIQESEIPEKEEYK